MPGGIWVKDSKDTEYFKNIIRDRLHLRSDLCLSLNRNKSQKTLAATCKLFEKVKKRRMTMPTESWRGVMINILSRVQLWRNSEFDYKFNIHSIYSKGRERGWKKGSFSTVINRNSGAKTEINTKTVKGKICVGRYAHLPAPPIHKWMLLK